MENLCQQLHDDLRQCRSTHRPVSSSGLPKGKWGSGSSNSLRYDPQNSSKNARKLFKKGVSSHLRDCKECGLKVVLKIENYTFPPPLESWVCPR